MRILVALEREPMTATDLSSLLDVPYDKVNWATTTLKKAGIIEVQSEQRGQQGKTVAILLTTAYRGWSDLATCLDDIASSAEV